MFVGHYGVAFAAKALQPERSLGELFVATQLMDVSYNAFLLAGLEHVRITPGAVGPGGVEMVSVPYSHGLLGAGALAAAYASVVGNRAVGNRARRPKRGRARRGAGRHATAAVASVVLSHWVLDVVVHKDGVPVLTGKTTVGLGMPTRAAHTLEVALLAGGLLLYLRSTQARSRLGRYAMPAFGVALAGFNRYVAKAPTPGSVKELAASTMSAYAGLAAVAAGLERQRVLRARRRK